MLENRELKRAADQFAEVSGQPKDNLNFIHTTEGRYLLVFLPNDGEPRMLGAVHWHNLGCSINGHRIDDEYFEGDQGLNRTSRGKALKVFFELCAQKITDQTVYVPSLLENPYEWDNVYLDAFNVVKSSRLANAIDRFAEISGLAKENIHFIHKFYGGGYYDLHVAQPDGSFVKLGEVYQSVLCCSMNGDNEFDRYLADGGVGNNARGRALDAFFKLCAAKITDPGIKVNSLLGNSEMWSSEYLEAAMPTQAEAREAWEQLQSGAPRLVNNDGSLVGGDPQNFLGRSIEDNKMVIYKWVQAVGGTLTAIGANKFEAGLWGAKTKADEINFNRAGAMQRRLGFVTPSALRAEMHVPDADQLNKKAFRQAQYRAAAAICAYPG